MGISYTLVKKDAPEAYHLGKGFWDKVFDRKFGFINPLTFKFIGSNFEKSFRVKKTGITNKIKRNFYFDAATCKSVSDDIVAWAGSSEIFLINYWEDIEYYKQKRQRKKCAEEFTDLSEFLVKPLYDYKITGSIEQLASQLQQSMANGAQSSRDTYTKKYLGRKKYLDRID